MGDCKAGNDSRLGDVGDRGATILTDGRFKGRGRICAVGNGTEVGHRAASEGLELSMGLGIVDGVCLGDETSSVTRAPCECDRVGVGVDTALCALTDMDELRSKDFVWLGGSNSEDTVAGGFSHIRSVCRASSKLPTG